jgi:hypothetical protein
MVLLMKRFIILLPLFSWFIWLSWLFYVQHQIAPYFIDINGMMWQINQTQWIAHLQQLPIPNTEEENFVITINDVHGNLVYTTELLVDYDLNNSGFIKAMQVDDDSEWEIVFATNNRTFAQNFYLDLSTGKIETKSLANVSFQVKQLIKKWFDYYVFNVFTTGFAIIFTVIFYGVYLLIFLAKCLL